MTQTTTEGIRRCIGSAKFGIEAHEAPVEDFPKQASQKDGLGRMCRVHWNAYTTALRKAALERKAAEPTAEEAPSQPEQQPAAEQGIAAEPEAEPAEASEPKTTRRNRQPRGGADGQVAQEGASG